MRVVVSSQQGGLNGVANSLELRRWLVGEPDLRGRIRGQDAAPAEGTMGAAADALIAVLEPGGIAAVFATAVVAWAQSRRSDQTITITRPDGVRITISSTQVRDLSGKQAADLAQQLAAAVTSSGPSADLLAGPTAPGPDETPQPDGTPPEAPRPSCAAPRTAQPGRTTPGP